MGLEHAWAAGYEVVNRAFAEAACDELEREPAASVWFHDYHLYLAPRLRSRSAPGRPPGALHPHPLGRSRRLGRPSAADRPSNPRGPAGQRRRRLPHPPLAGRVSRDVPLARARAGAQPRHRQPDLGRRRGVRGACRQPLRARAGARARGDEIRAADPPRGPNRSLEERRSGARRRSSSSSTAAPTSSVA